MKKQKKRKSQNEEYKHTKLSSFSKLARKQGRLAPVCEACYEAPAVEPHHMKGRVGDDLTNEHTLIWLCHECHSHATHHPKDAIERGISVRRNDDSD